MCRCRGRRLARVAGVGDAGFGRVQKSLIRVLVGILKWAIRSSWLAGSVDGAVWLPGRSVAGGAWRREGPYPGHSGDTQVGHSAFLAHRLVRRREAHRLYSFHRGMDSDVPIERF